jgi:prepilin peptidase CpaA
MNHLLQSLLVLVFPAVVIAAALRDTVSYTIPNWMPLALAGAFPVAALALRLPLEVVWLNAVVGLAALLAGMGMFAAGWIGGGDAKLFAAAALWLGLPAGPTYLMVTCLAGGVLTLGLLALRSHSVRVFVLSGPAWFVRLAEPGENVPYGVAIAAGALAAFPLSSLAAGLRLGV